MMNIVYSFVFFFGHSTAFLSESFPIETCTENTFHWETQYVIFRLLFVFIHEKKNNRKLTKKQTKLGSLPSNQLWIEHGHVIKMVKLDKLHHFHSSWYDAFHSSNTACFEPAIFVWCARQYVAVKWNLCSRKYSSVINIFEMNRRR